MMEEYLLINLLNVHPRGHLLAHLLPQCDTHLSAHLRALVIKSALGLMLNYDQRRGCGIVKMIVEPEKYIG